MLLIYLVIINIVTFVLYAADKVKAMRHKWRIPEAVLLFFALIGGSVGALLGMVLCRHKTKHRKFTIGVPLILILQVVLFYVVFR